MPNERKQVEAKLTARRAARDDLDRQIAAIAARLRDREDERTSVRAELSAALIALAALQAQPVSGETARQIAKQQAAVSKLEARMSEFKPSEDDAKLAELSATYDALDNECWRLDSVLGLETMLEAGDELAEMEAHASELAEAAQAAQAEAEQARQDALTYKRAVPARIAAQWPAYADEAAQKFRVREKVARVPSDAERVLAAFRDYARVLIHHASDARRVHSGVNVAAVVNIPASELEHVFNNSPEWQDTGAGIHKRLRLAEALIEDLQDKNVPQN